jgi:Zn-dependent M28 family amino/carboxypeptidase
MKPCALLFAIGMGMHASLLNAADTHAFGPDITAADFAAHLEVLASDEFGGRAPATPAEEKTVLYLRDQFERMGLSPGNGDDYFQNVPIQIRIIDFSNSKASIDLDGKPLTLALGTQVVLGSESDESSIRIADSPMLFVGYGIDAPDQNWNDYAGTDVRGKTVVMLAGEPAANASERNLFEGRPWTHYSRWAYKVEEAARQGAAAAIVVHDTQDAGYNWDGVKERWMRPQVALRMEPHESRVRLHAWITDESAHRFFHAAGLDLSTMRDAAGRRGFKAVALGTAKFSGALPGKMLFGQSRNVIAKLTGSTFPDEAIVYSAHWDHLGTQLGKSGDNIYNGAIDNASGVAAVLEIAARFAAQQPKPQRSILFLIPTLEELGLLGSKYYTAHPVVRLASTVADINFDMIAPIGRARDFVAIGIAYSELEDVLRPVVARQGRVLSAEPSSEKDSFFRSDHLSFAKAGVPVLYVRGGMQRSGVVPYGIARDEIWNRVVSTYHTPDDEFDHDWDLGGIVDDLEVAHEVGTILASSRDWPNYRAGHIFRQLRDASRKGRQSPETP